MAVQITVKDARTDGRVALWERHPDHPNGEIYIAGGNTVTCAATPAVLTAIREGALEEIREPAVPAKAPAPEKPAKEK